MSALDMQGNYSVLLIVSAVCVKKFENLHKSVALEMAIANKGAWIPAKGKLHKVTLVLVLDENGYTIEELKTPYEEARDLEPINYVVDFKEVEKPTLTDVRRLSGFSKSQLAEKADVDVKTISRAENGLPVLDVKLSSILNALNIKLGVKFALKDIDGLVIR